MCKSPIGYLDHVTLYDLNIERRYRQTPNDGKHLHDILWDVYKTRQRTHLSHDELICTYLMKVVYVNWISIPVNSLY